METRGDGPDVKDWDFPKIHSQQHLFDDIVAKGATRNYNTKPNESLNRPLKGIYVNQTNFRDVAEQVSLIHIQLNHSHHFTDSQSPPLGVHCLLHSGKT